MKKLLLTGAFLFLLTPSALASFPDVDPNSEHAQAINELQELGVIEGYPDGTFGEDKEVSRVEFLKMAFLAESLATREGKWEREVFPFGKEEGILVDPSDFTDFDPEAWYAPYTSWGKQEGIVKGYPDGRLGAEEPVIFAEAAKMMVEAASDPEVYKGGHWAEGYFYALGVHTNPSSITAADQVLTRGQVAELIWRYTQATDRELENKLSRMTVWNEDHFLNLEYVGFESSSTINTHYLEGSDKIYSLTFWYDRPSLYETEIDAESFEIDNIRVEYEDWNGNSVKKETYIARDDYGVYERGRQRAGSLGGPIELVENSIIVMPDDKSKFYVHDNQTVYIVHCSGNCYISEFLPYSNAESFVYLAGGLSKDKYRVYYFNLDSSILDPETFEHLGSEQNDDSLCHFPFFRDKEHLYLNESRLLEVDLDTVEFLHPYGLFFRDEKNVYRTINHTEYLCFYEKYSKKIAILDNVAPDDFLYIGPNHFVSNNILYYIDDSGLINPVFADINTFEVLLPEESVNPYDYFLVGPFGKDADHAYYSGKVIQGIDAATFEYNEEEKLWMDKNGSYTFTELNEKIN